MLQEDLSDNLSTAFASRVTIDGGALAANVQRIKTLIGAEVKLMAVVKANAYGHGAVAVARIALDNGADMLAVANLNEAKELRDAGIGAPILVLSFVPAESIPYAIKRNLCLTVYDTSQACQYQLAAKSELGRLTVQVKVDSGMGRLGVPTADALALCEQVRGLPALNLDGIYTHFSAADSDAKHTEEQLSRFRCVLEQLQRAGFRFRHIHAANSAAVLTCPASHFNLVRPD